MWNLVGAAFFGLSVRPSNGLCQFVSPSGNLFVSHIVCQLRGLVRHKSVSQSVDLCVF
jgi:hypothetical protein